MKPREFLYTLTDIVRKQLGPQMQDFQAIGPTMSLVKLHYGAPAVHYEVCVRKRQREIELGLLVGCGEVQRDGGLRQR